MKTLFVIDMQKDFLLDSGKLNLGHDTKDLIQRVSHYIRDFKGHVVLTQDSHNADSCEFPAFPEHCIFESEGWDLADDIYASVQGRRPVVTLPPQAEPVDPRVAEMLKEKKGDDSVEVIFKRTFGGLGIMWTLDEETIRGEIHLAGVCTHICIHDTVALIVNFAKEKFNIQPKVIVHKDLIDDFNSEMAEMTLKRMQSLYGVEIV